MKISGMKSIARILLVALVFAAVPAFAGKDNFTIAGHVESAYQNGPIEFPNQTQSIVVVSVPSTIDVYAAIPTPPNRKGHQPPLLKFVTEITTDENGYFLINKLNRGNYIFFITPDDLDLYGLSEASASVPVNLRTLPFPGEENGIEDFFVPYYGVTAF